MPVQTTILAVEGVLMPVNATLTAASPDQAGLALYNAFVGVGRVVLASSYDRRMLDHWLRISGLRGHASIYPLTSNTVERARAAGETPSLYIDTDPERVAAAVRHGVAAMMFARPIFQRAGFQRQGLPGLRKPFAAVMTELGVQEHARTNMSFEDDDDPMHENT